MTVLYKVHCIMYTTLKEKLSDIISGNCLLYTRMFTLT